MAYQDAVGNAADAARLSLSFGEGKVAGSEIRVILRLMSKVDEIEEAIARLPSDEFLRLREWVQHRFDDEWDRQFDADARSGALSSAAAAAIAEHRAGRSAPFPADEELGRQ